MVFSTTIFLFLFLPIFLFIYFISPSKLKNIVLLFFSLVFYTWGEDKLVGLLLVSAIVDFSCGKIIEKGHPKLGLFSSIIFNLLLLLSFKYLDFTFENFNNLMRFFEVDNPNILSLPGIALPIGISFYTFQTMSYTIDVYRKNVKASRSFLEFATYVTMFPQLVAGPIVRYSDIQQDLSNRKHTIEQIYSGLEKFIIGLIKKVLIANTFAVIADSIFNVAANDLSTPLAWLGVIAYTFQIYFDFSGYSDMAIGLGRILGFNFPENFNFPYVAKSIRDFWRRWHISLSTWFRDYLYISLGGNRKGLYRTYINLLIVFFITGLWHGASWNFIIWGLFHGLFLILEKNILGRINGKLHPFFRHFYVILVVMIGWVFFRSDDLSYALVFLHQMFIPSNGNVVMNEYLTFFHLNLSTLFFCLIAIIFCLPSHRYIKKWLESKKMILINQLALIVLLLVSITYLTADTYNPFIYFKF